MMTRKPLKKDTPLIGLELRRGGEEARPGLDGETAGDVGIPFAGLELVAAGLLIAEGYALANEVKAR